MIRPFALVLSLQLRYLGLLYYSPMVQLEHYIQFATSTTYLLVAFFVGSLICLHVKTLLQAPLIN
jgi:hypothetical protein